MTISAGLIIIGNEILSGRTQDKNIQFIADHLNQLNISLKEVRVIRDEENAIIAAVNALRAIYTYVFTTGGIGPTHDDITAECIAKALGKEFLEHPEALKRLESHYKDNLNSARKRMAMMPSGAQLIDNQISAAPGFYCENVFVLAGVPMIMQVMFENVRNKLLPGSPWYTETLNSDKTEGTIAEQLRGIQLTYPEVEIGSYPFFKAGKVGATIILRSLDNKKLQEAKQAVARLLD